MTNPTTTQAHHGPARGGMPTERRQPSAPDQLRALAAATPLAERHLLIDQVVDAIGQTLPELPDNGRCVCGRRLNDGSSVYSLDYSVGWQPIAYDGADWTGCTKINDQHTVAEVMCPDCRRIYCLPDGVELVWG